MANPNNIPFVTYRINSNDDEVTGVDYDYAILRLRVALGDACVASGGNSRFVLVEYTNNVDKVRMFDIVFQRDRTTSVTVRFRRDDLYVLGYQVSSGTDTQQWREFAREDGRHLVDPNSRHLPFDGSYTRLEDEGGKLTRLTLDREALRQAVDRLVRSVNSAEIARGLSVIIMMFSEAARFRPVQTFIQTVFVPNELSPITCNIPDWMTRQEHIWRDLSGYVLYYFRHPYEKWVPQRIEILGPIPSYEPVTVVAGTIGEALFYMGILQDNPESIKPAPRN